MNNLVNDLLAVAGFASLTYGLYLIDLSLALCASGSMLTILALCMSRKAGNDSKPFV